MVQALNEMDKQLAEMNKDIVETLTVKRKLYDDNGKEIGEVVDVQYITKKAVPNSEFYRLGLPIIKALLSGYDTDDFISSNNLGYVGYNKYWAGKRGQNHVETINVESGNTQLTYQVRLK